VQELQEAFDAVVAHNPDDANLQPERLADVLPAMTREPIAALRKAVDGKSKDAFEKAYDGLSAACTGCHRVAGNDMLVIQRPKTPLLDNLRVTPIK
jgi:cytochrome c553